MPFMESALKFRSSEKATELKKISHFYFYFFFEMEKSDREN